MYTAVLRLGTKHKCGYEFKLWTPTETAYHGKIFKAVYTVALYKDGLPKLDIKEFPAEISVDIPKFIKPKSKK